MRRREVALRCKRINMCDGPILTVMLRFGLPVLATGLLQQFFNSADVILARHLATSGNDAVAAVGSTTALTSLMINFFIGCSTGSAVTVSRAFGSGDKDAVKQSIHTAMLLALLLGGVLTVGGWTMSRTMLTMMGTPDSIIDLSTQYLNAYFSGMIPHMVYNFGAAILRAIGQSSQPLFFLMISGPLKLLFTIFFVSVCNMDVAGLAFANSCAQTVSAALVVISLLKRKDHCKLTLKSLKFYRKSLKKILQLGIPSGIQSATFSLSNVFIQTSVNSLAVIPGFITGNAAASSICAFADTLTGALYQISLNFTGQNSGALKYDRIKKGYLTTTGLTCVAVGAVACLVCIFSEQLLGLYIADDPEAIYWGKVRIMILFIPLVFQGLMDISSGALRGLEISLQPMVFSLVGICGLRILWSLTIFQIPQFHTPQMLFMCYPITWIVTYIAELILYITMYKKLKKKFCIVD